MKDLSEAILHCEEKAKELYCKADKDFYFDGDWGKRYHCTECAKEHEQLASWLKELKELRKVITWIPIKTRPLTEEEKLNAIEKHDIDPDDLEYPFAWHFDCELPKLKEGEQSVDVLVTTDLGFVKVTNFFIDYLGCTCFEDMDEAGEFVAWMPLPERYEAEVQDD